MTLLQGQPKLLVHVQVTRVHPMGHRPLKAVYERSQNQGNNLVNQWHSWTAPSPLTKWYELEIISFVSHRRVDKSLRRECQWILPCLWISSDGPDIHQHVATFWNGAVHRFTRLQSFMNEKRNSRVQPLSLFYACMKIVKMRQMGLPHYVFSNLPFEFRAKVFQDRFVLDKLCHDPLNCCSGSVSACNEDILERKKSQQSIMMQSLQ